MNLLLLFFMSLIPLATGFLGEHPQLARAISFYALIMTLSSAVFGLLRYRLGRMPDHDRGHIQFRRATLVRSFTGTLLYATAAIAAPISSVAALALLVFVRRCSTSQCCSDATGRVDASRSLCTRHAKGNRPHRAFYQRSATRTATTIAP